MTASHYLIPGLSVPSNTELIPRHLTEQEIDYLIQFVPLPLVASTDNQQLIRSQQQATLAAQLAKYPIVPDAIPELIREYVEHCYRSTVVPGTSIGIVLSTAIGRILSQMTLSSFHHIGEENTGANAIVQTLALLYVQKDYKHQMCYIHFRNPLLTHLDINDMLKYFDGVTLLSFIEDYEYRSTDTIPEPWQARLLVDDLSEVWAEHKCYLRIKLNRYLLYKYRIVPQQLARYFTAIDENAIIISSPIQLGYLDVFATPNMEADGMKNYGNLDIPQYLMEQLYFASFITNDKILGKDTILGIPGISETRIKRVPLASLVTEEVVTVNNKKVKGLKWNERARKFPVTMDNLTRWLTTAEIDHTVVDDMVVTTLSPSESLLGLLATKRMDENIRDHNIGLLSLHSEYCYAMAKGGNIIGVYRLPFVSNEWSFTDNLVVMEKVLGIEAARNFFIMRLNEIFVSAGLTVERSLIELLASLQSNRGRFLGANYAGAVQTGRDSLGLAAIERAMEIIREGIFLGKQPLTVASSTMVGAYVGLGTGRVMMGYQGTINEEPFLTTGDDIYVKMIADDRERQLRSYAGWDRIEASSSVETELPSEPADSTIGDRDPSKSISTLNDTPDMDAGIQGSLIVPSADVTAFRQLLSLSDLF